MAQSSNQIGPLGVTKSAVKSSCCKLTLKECLTLLIGTTIPVVIAIYTAVTNEQIQKSAKLAADEQQRIASERRSFDLQQAAELYQQQIHKSFLDDMYTLQKDGQLNDSADPWVFANARYRAAHRVWDASRKAQVLQFLKERQLIGHQNCTTGCRIKHKKNIIRLNGLDFDYVNLSSPTGRLSQIDLSCVEFHQVSMTNAILSSVNMHGVKFSESRLDGVKFSDVSLKCATFEDTTFNGTDFGNSNLDGALFINVDSSTIKLTSTQMNQSTFRNVIISYGTKHTSEQANKQLTTVGTMLNETAYTSKQTKIQSTPAGTMLNETAYTSKQTKIQSTPAGTMRNETAYTSKQTKIQSTPAAPIRTTVTSPVSTKSIPKTCYDTKWTPKGVTVAGDEVYGNALNQLHEPISLYIDVDETLLIADSHNDRIVAWKLNATSGQVVAGGNGPGNRTDQLHQPTSVAVSRGIESLIICDQGNRRVIQWPRRSKNGQTIISNILCWGLAIDDQNFIYVPIGTSTDLTQEVRRYRIGESTGIVVAGGNGRGNRLSQLCIPTHVFIDRAHSLYVLDKGNERVVKWVKNASVGILVAGFQGSGVVDHLNSPTSVFVDPLETVYVTDAFYHTVVRWCKGDIRGEVMWSKITRDRDILRQPNGFALDTHGNIYVVDTMNHRIQRYSIEVN